MSTDASTLPAFPEFQQIEAIGFFVVYVDPYLGSKVPSSLDVTVEFRSADDTTTGSLHIPLDVTTPLKAIGPPMSGSGWVAGNGLTNKIPGAHRRSILPMPPISFAQRFAIDWMQYVNGSLYSGDGSKNEDWFGYNHDLLAVADGKVVHIMTDVSLNTPFHPPAVNITIANVCGNHVVLDIGDGNFVLYAHMIPGSATVTLNETVKKGQVLGKLGNTGNSGAPHLHLHVARCSVPVMCSDRAYVFESFWLQDQLFGHPFDMPGRLWLGERKDIKQFVSNLPQDVHVVSWEAPEAPEAPEGDAACSSAYNLVASFFLCFLLFL